MPIALATVADDQHPPANGSCNGSATTIGTDGTDINGIYSLTYRPGAVGAHDIESSYAGNAAHAPATACATLTTNVAPTLTSVNLGSTSITTAGSTTATGSVISRYGISPNHATGSLSFQVFSATNCGSGLLSTAGSNETINVVQGDADNNPVSEIGFSFSSSGTHTISGLGVGTYGIRANFSDTDGNYAGSSACQTLTVVSADSTAPVVTITTDAADTIAGTGWYNIATSGTNGVLVHVSASDPAGVTNITCVDNSSTTVLNTATSSSTFVLGNGTHGIVCAATDGLGNTGASAGSTAMPVSYQIDETSPTISNLGPTTAANGAGWYKTDVTNTFTANDSGSGRDSACATAFPGGSQTKTTSGEGVGLTVTSDGCTDVAGNSTSGVTSATFKVDKTGPAITASAKTADLNTYVAGTWTNQTVTVTFSCADASGSGIGTDTTGGDTGVQSTETSSGSFTSVGSHCVDTAGNSATSNTFSPIKVDLHAPTITNLGPTSGPNGASWYKTDVTNTFSASDGLSGLNAACLAAFPNAGDQQTKTTTGEGTTVHVTSDGCTDVAGNSSSGIDSANFKVDKTAPTISDLGATTAPNLATWYKTDVTNTFSASDAGSGLDATCLAAFSNAGDRQTKTTTGEGAALTVTSDGCSDVAGNGTIGVTSASFSVDKTAPTITNVGPTSSPNGAGWYNHDVTNTFSAGDSLSGLNAACLAAFPNAGDQQTKTTTGEGTTVHVTSDGCTDVAGNGASAIDSANFSVDKTAPTITNLGPTTAPNLATWYKTDVTNTFSVSDLVSGPNAACALAFPGGSQTKTTTGEGATVHVTSDGCTDIAGNGASAIDSANFKVDKTAPTISSAVTPAAAGTGWWNIATGAPTVTYTCGDALSGLASCSSPHLFGEGAALGDTGTAVDVAGNSNTASVSGIKVDLHAPTITNLGPTSGPNGASWYKTDVTNTFQAADAVSGLDATCLTNFATVTHTQLKTTTGEGLSIQVASSSCSDVAGNTAGAISSSPFKVDKTAPANLAFVGGGLTNGGIYSFGFVPAGPTSCTATDTLSGFKSCTLSGYSTALGAHTVLASALDIADNSATNNLNYTVNAWTLKGFYQPVDMNNVVNTVKGGSTVPLKFNVYAGSTELTSTSYIKGFKAVQVTCGEFTDMAADAIEITSTGGTSLRYDTSQFIQNWQTPKTPGACYVVAMTTLDGSSLFANFMLK